MRIASLIISLLMIAACTDTPKAKPVVDKAGRKFLYLFGFIYGPVEKMVQTSVNSLNDKRETSVLTFYDNGKKVAWENNGKTIVEIIMMIDSESIR
jgi:hypothetical protein